VFDGRIYHAHTGAAGEGGHMSIDYRGPVCGCGKHGCIEALAAGSAIGARARAQIAAGDSLAREALRETVEMLTAWLGNIVDLLDPDVFVIGGGVAAM
jgi:predicted NBD/HSP70 family sugar kinase